MLCAHCAQSEKKFGSFLFQLSNVSVGQANVTDQRVVSCVCVCVLFFSSKVLWVSHFWFKLDFDFYQRIFWIWNKSVEQLDMIRLADWWIWEYLYFDIECCESNRNIWIKKKKKKCGNFGFIVWLGGKNGINGPLVL